MEGKAKKKRYQISIGDPKVCALLDLYPREKGRIVEEALNLYLKTDNTYTRQIRKLTEEAAENLRLLSSLTGDQVRVLEDVGDTSFNQKDKETEEDTGDNDDLDLIDESDLMLMG